MATAARTYNQDHVARKYALGHRRVSIYWTWSYPWETNRDLAPPKGAKVTRMLELKR